MGWGIEEKGFGERSVKDAPTKDLSIKVILIIVLLVYSYSILIFVSI